MGGRDGLGCLEGKEELELWGTFVFALVLAVAISSHGECQLQGILGLVGGEELWSRVEPIGRMPLMWPS